MIWTKKSQNNSKMFVMMLRCLIRWNSVCLSMFVSEFIETKLFSISHKLTLTIELYSTHTHFDDSHRSPTHETHFFMKKKHARVLSCTSMTLCVFWYIFASEATKLVWYVHFKSEIKWRLQRIRFSFPLPVQL